MAIGLTKLPEISENRFLWNFNVLFCQGKQYGFSIECLRLLSLRFIAITTYQK